MGRPPKSKPHKRNEDVRRLDNDEEALVTIGRTYNVSPQTTRRLGQ